MTATTIRPAQLNDAQRIADFNRAMARETEQRELDADILLRGVRRMLESGDGGFYLVAEIDGQVCGCLMVTFEWSDWRDGRFWWIQSVYVAPDFRRRGVFRQLYQHVHQQAARQDDVCGIRLYVEQDNQIAQQTYQTLGMTATQYRLFETEFPPQ